MASRRSPSPDRNDQFRSAAQACEEAFEFLVTDFGFDLSGSVVDSSGFEIRYKGSAIGVRTNYRIRDDFSVYVSVLDDSEFPVSLGEIRADSRIREFDMLDIEALSAGGEPDYAAQDFGLPDAEGFESYAARLRTAAGDLLAGDLRRVPLLEKRVLDRAEEMAWRKWGDRAVDLGWPARD